MSLITPNGIQVRFDPERIDPCIKTLKDGGHIDKILMDLELWENMPSALSNVMAISAAVITKSTLSIIVFSLLGYILGTMIKLGSYSKFLKRLLPQVLGSPIISIISAACVGLYLSQDKAIAPIIVLLLVVTNNGLGPFNIYEVLIAPIRLLFYRRYAKRADFPHTRIDRNFVAICNRKADDLGVTLPWPNEPIGDGGS
jgi:hypothetical protein